ncbi:nuclease [Rhodococcus sp. 15-649-2-2]|nr:nuclease [Rhodococcus sp. 15-649-2-2]
MMPAYCPIEAPPGERLLFKMLAADDTTSDWIALHSLGLASHVKQVDGEADFVVLVPNRGIVVIEVKSHRHVERTVDGRWKLGNHAPEPRSPFQQVQTAMYSIRNYLINHNIDLRSVPIVDVVWFTHLRANPELQVSPEWHKWQLLDSSDLHKSASAAILKALTKGTAHLQSRIHGFAVNGAGPDQHATARIAHSLRPRFEVATLHGDMRNQRTSQMAEFIDEQYDALDNMQQNSSVLFTGPAGSGKTWLAIEAAKRELAKSQVQGRLLCFNRLLGEHTRIQTKTLANLTTSTFHQELIRITGLTPPDRGVDAFWTQHLPNAAIDAILNDSDAHTLDFLVVDEVQDLAQPQYLDVLDLMVKGGLKGGRVLLFGDFERQAIYGARPDGLQLVKAAAPGISTYSLTINCRNLPRIGTVVKRLSKLIPGYRRYRREDDGFDPAFLPYESSDQQTSLLIKAVRDLKAEGYKNEEIVILSPLNQKSAARTTSDPWLRQLLRPEDGRAPVPGKLRFTTIHSFKGLDSPAVVLTDLKSDAATSFEAILYIGLTRATDRLTAIIEMKTLKQIYGGRA